MASLEFYERFPPLYKVELGEVFVLDPKSVKLYSEPKYYSFNDILSTREVPKSVLNIIPDELRFQRNVIYRVSKYKLRKQQKHKDENFIDKRTIEYKRLIKPFEEQS